MKILVTGASGFVGGELVKDLITKGHTVRALVRKTSRIGHLKKSGADIYYGDITDAGSLPNALEGMNAVVHTAGLVGEAGKREDFIRVNIEGTRNLLNACRQIPLQRFVYISSLSVITGYRDHNGTKEDAPYQPTGEHYADTKIEAEKLVLEYYRKHQLPAVVLRPGFIYGPGDQLFLPTVIENLRKGKVILIDGGKKLLNLTYVGNLVEAIELALEKDVIGQIFNITDGEKITKAAFFNVIADQIGLPHPSKSMSFATAKLLCSIITTIYKVFRIKSPPPISRMKLRFAGQNQWFDISLAKHNLGYKHRTTFDQGVRNTIAWIQSVKEQDNV